MVNKYSTTFMILFLFLVLNRPADATILWKADASAQSGACNSQVSTSVWDPNGGSEAYPHNILYLRCDTPVPGRTKYLRADTVDLQHDSWNLHYLPSNIPLTPGTKYYYGAFVRFDQINGQDVWNDGNVDGQTSADKYLELVGPGMRIFIMAGFNGWPICQNNRCDHHFTFTASFYESTCAGCNQNIIWGLPNVSPFNTTDFYYMNYGRWYSVVLGLTPSSGSTTNGRVEFWINGTKTMDYQNVKTQDATSPSVEHFSWSGTTDQPDYNAPAHQRKFDYVILTDSLTDITSAGLMSDPQAGSGILTPAQPNPPVLSAY